jgi:hypothetical protein
MASEERSFWSHTHFRYEHHRGPEIQPPLWTLKAVLWTTVLLVLIHSDLAHGQKRIDPAVLEEYCKNFTHGNQDAMQFYSPMYPRDYPPDISCFRTITAEFGFFVRIDFRDVFRIEPPNNEGTCEYDYLEIRDGDQGYSPLIGKTF